VTGGGSFVLARGMGRTQVSMGWVGGRVHVPPGCKFGFIARYHKVLNLFAEFFLGVFFWWCVDVMSSRGFLDSVSGEVYAACTVPIFRIPSSSRVCI